MSNTKKLLDELMTPDEQRHLERRATAAHALESAAYIVYAHPIPATHRAYDEALTVAKRCGLTRAEIHQTINAARKEAFHGWT